MTRASAATRALGVLLVAVLLALGLGLDHATGGTVAASQVTSATTDPVPSGHEHCDGHDSVPHGRTTSVSRPSPSTPVPPATVAGPVSRPVIAVVATARLRHSTSGQRTTNQRLAALQTFRC